MDQAQQPVPRPSGKNKLRKIGFISLLVIIGLWFVFYFICGMAYSEGTRSGILTKVSKRGYIFKTYEGELIIGGLNQGDGAILPGAIFNFSIIDKNVYDMLEADQGRKVILHYKQVLKPFFWQGDTDYFVNQVTFIK